MIPVSTENTATAGVEIALADVCFEVDSKQILRGITHKTAAHRIGIVGRNGSGKSTLARVIAGLVAPTAGRVRVGGHNLSADRKQALREIGILFQNPDHQIIFPTVREEIGFGLRQLGQGKQATEESVQDTLAFFGKSHWADAHVHTLSQGQKHLVCLMAVVAMAPRMIILDEPFTGLDIPTKAQLTRALAQYRGSLLHITHDPADLAEYDHVIWIEQGEIVQAGEARAVLDAYVSAMEQQGASDDIAILAG
ncbi:energy-coupling factor ABC transporter ATP-binding protein [Yoonia sp. MH D7]